MKNNAYQILSIALNEGKAEGLKVIEMPFEAFRVIEVEKECIEDYFKMPESKYKGVALLVHESTDNKEVEILFNEDFKPSNQNERNWDYAVVIALLNNNINQDYLNSLLSHIAHVLSQSKHSLKRPKETNNDYNSEVQALKIYKPVDLVFKTLRYPFWIEKSPPKSFKDCKDELDREHSKELCTEQLDKQEDKQDNSSDNNSIDGFIAEVRKTGRIADDKNLLADTNPQNGSINKTNPFEDMVFSYKNKNRGISATATYNPNNNTMTVLKGSLFSMKLSHCSSANLASVRDAMIVNKELIKKDDSLELQCDHTFRDSEQAINAVTGGILVLGRHLWENEAGVTLELVLNDYYLKNPTEKQHKDDNTTDYKQLHDNESVDTVKDNREQSLVDTTDTPETPENDLDFEFDDVLDEDRIQEDTPDIKDIVFTCENSEKNVFAKAKYIPRINNMMVLKGSKFTKEYSALNDTYKEKIQKLLEEGSLQERADFFELIVDHRFNSPSMACGIALGSHAKAMEVWRSKYGTLGEKKNELKKDFSCKHDGKKVFANATYYSPTKELLVHKGSRFSQHMTPSKIGGEAHAEKQKMVEDGLLVLKNDYYVLTKDYLFSNVSRASEVVTGASGGRKIWINYFGEDIADAYHSFYSFY